LDKKVNVFRYQQGLDDQMLLFWRPSAIYKGEWPYIYALKLEEGNLIANSDVSSSI
jgi:hypothetical protein